VHWLSSSETKKFKKEGVATYRDTHIRRHFQSLLSPSIIYASIM
jgi:hypothetical protein